MANLIVPEIPDLSGKPKPQKIQAVVMFQDTNYTIMRNKDAKQMTQEDIFNLPLHLVLIACGMIDASTYVPKIGKQGFLDTIKRLKKQFDANYKKQKAVATNMQERPARKSYRGNLG